MMASDSDESDYEDARQHHDNEDDNSDFPPIAASSSSRLTVSQSSAVDSGESRDESENSNQRLASPQRPVSADQQLNNQDNAIPIVVQNDHANDIAAAENLDADEVPILEGNNNNLAENVALINDEAERVIIRLQGYFRDNPNPIVVDSDDDDADTFSDSEMDFLVLNPDDGESECFLTTFCN